MRSTWVRDRPTLDPRHRFFARFPGVGMRGVAVHGAEEARDPNQVSVRLSGDAVFGLCRTLSTHSSRTRCSSAKRATRVPRCQSQYCNRSRRPLASRLSAVGEVWTRRMSRGKGGREYRRDATLPGARWCSAMSPLDLARQRARTRAGKSPAGGAHGEPRDSRSTKF